MEVGMKIKRMLVAALILIIVVMIASRGCRGLRGKGRHIKRPLIAHAAGLQRSSLDPLNIIPL